MPINNPVPQSAVRQPRMLALINGQPAAGLKSIEVENNSFYQADTFRATLSLSAQPATNDLNWWSSQTAIDCEIFAGFPTDPVRYTKADLTSLILGQVDHMEFDLLRGEIHLTGRDWSAKFIDAQTTEKFQNQTASQIAQALAARHGMTAQVTATTTKAGLFYEIDHVRLTDRKTEWDLLTWLAQEEDMAVFVKGKTLYFQPRPQPTDDPYILQYQAGLNGPASANFMDVRLERALTLSNGVVVNVRTWNQKQKKGFTVSYPKKVSSTKATKAPQQYWYVKPNLDTQKALAFAQQKYHEIVAHEMKLRAEMPGDVLLTCQNIIKLGGTASAFDQVFYPSAIHRRMSWDEGFRMDIEAKNHSTESQAEA